MGFALEWESAVFGRQAGVLTTLIPASSHVLEHGVQLYSEGNLGILDIIGVWTWAICAPDTGAEISVGYVPWVGFLHNPRPIRIMAICHITLDSEFRATCRCISQLCCVNLKVALSSETFRVPQPQFAYPKNIPHGVALPQPCIRVSRCSAGVGPDSAPTQKFPNYPQNSTTFAPSDRLEASPHDNDNTAAMANNRVTYRRRNP